MRRSAIGASACRSARVLAFWLELGGAGIWIGLATGLAVVAILMMLRWLRRESLSLMIPGDAAPH